MADLTHNDPRLTPRSLTGTISLSEEVNLRAIAAVFWSERWIILMCLGVCLIASIYYVALHVTPTYRATSVVILKTNQDQIVDLHSVATGLSGDSSEVNSELEVLRSRSLLEQVVEQLGLISDPEFNTLLAKPLIKLKLRGITSWVFQSAKPQPGPLNAMREKDRVTSKLLSQVKVSNVRASLVFRITASSNDAAKAALIADKIAETYIADQIAVKRRTTQQATLWLKTQVGELQKTLQEAEAKVADFSAQTELISTDALRALERQTKELRDRIINVTEDKSEVMQQLYKLTADSPPTRSKAQAQKEYDLSRMQRQLSSLQAAEKTLMRQIYEQNEDLITLQQLTREADAARVLYEYFLTRFNETSAQQGIQQADSRILSRAVIPGIASEPQAARILSINMLIAMVLSAGLVFLRNVLQTGVRSMEELERTTGHRVLGQVPTLPIDSRRALLPYIRAHPTSAAIEAVRNLRTSLVSSNTKQKPRVIMSTSALPGEGKTTTAIALSQSLLGLDQKVLLIGADIRANTFRQYFNTLPSTGLVSTLTGDADPQDVIYSSTDQGFDILTDESAPMNAADLFASPTFADLLEHLRGQYTAIVIDSPPILVVPDARLIAQLADAVLLNVQWGKTHTSHVVEALRLLETSDPDEIGLVLSRVSAKSMQSYGYGAYEQQMQTHLIGKRGIIK